MHIPFSRGTRTPDSDLLKLAILIPTLNEAEHIQATLQSVVRQPGVKEVIVVDGGSSDGTASLARACGAKVIKSAPGRGKQLNAGWRASRHADWCLFLHADTQLPPGFHRLISDAVASQHQQQQQQQQSPQWLRPLQALQGQRQQSDLQDQQGRRAGQLPGLNRLQTWLHHHQQQQAQAQQLQPEQEQQRQQRQQKGRQGQCQQQREQWQHSSNGSALQECPQTGGVQCQSACWGCFSSIRLDQVPAWQSWLLQAAVELRTRLLHQPYGDQALFVRRSTLQALNGFKEWKLLEDYDLVQQLNKLSPPAIVSAPVATSGRLYKAAGFWQVVLAHQRILYAYNVAGASPDALQAIRSQLLKQQVC